MRTVWPIDLERATQLVAVFLPLLEEVGEERFGTGIDRMIANRPATTDDGFRLGFPMPSELRAYLPRNPRILDREQREREELDRLRRDRELHPDNYIGEADAIVMMRIIAEKIEKKSPRDPDEIWNEVIATRKLVLERLAIQEKLERRER